MGFSVLCIALYIIFGTCPHGLAFTEKLNSHIIDKRQYAVEELNDILTTAKREVSEIKIDLDLSEVTPLPNFTEPHHFHLFNQTFFLMGPRIYDQITDEPALIQEGYLVPRIEGNVLFLRSVQFDNLGVVLISFDTGISHVYVLKNVSNPEHIQSLDHRTTLTDAKFFMLHNSVYLITINSNAVKDSTIVYKWLGYHFDKIDADSKENAVGLSTFSLMHLEIIAVIHSSESNEKVVTLYEFDGNLLKKTQLLKISTAYRIFSYNLHDKIFMVVYGSEDNFVYLWDTFAAEFVYHEQFQTTDPIVQELVETINGTQFIFLISNASIEAYSSSESKLKKLSQANFEKPYQLIGDATHVADDRKLYIYGRNQDELELLTIYYTITSIAIESSTEEHCLKSLQDKLQQQLGFYSNKYAEPNNGELVKAAYQSPKKEVTYKEKARSDDAEVPELEPDYSPFDDTISQIREKMGKASQRITDMKHKSSELHKTNRTILGDVLVTGSLEAKRLQAPNINFGTVNDVIWEPTKWLSYSTEQDITGEIIMPELITKSLKLSEEGTPLEGALFKTGNATITKPILTKSLESINLFVKSINSIPFEDIYLKNQPAVVAGIKQFKNLITKNLMAKSLNGSEPGVPHISQFIFASEVKIDNLEVYTIDGVNWDMFKSSLFQLENSTNITGSLTISKALINKLNTKRINGIDVKDFMTTSTDQTIRSRLDFDHIEVENATATAINGIDFNGVVEISNSGPTFVNGPVTIQKMTVLNTTFVHPDQDNWMYNNGHIIGTHQSDFLQRYNRKVKILGNVHLKNLYLAEDSEIRLNNTEFKFENSEKYWLKDRDQNISRGVTMRSLKTPNIVVKSLNDIPIEDYMLNNNNDKLSTNYHFHNITILGNIQIDDDMEHSPNLQKLDKKIVKTTTCQKITGMITVRGAVTTNEADIIYLDDDDTGSVVTINTEELSGRFIFDTIVVTGNLTVEEIKVKLVNNRSMEALFDGMIMIDSKMNLNKFHIEDVYSSKLNIIYLNGKNFDDYLRAIDQIHNLTEIGNMTVKGNCNVHHLDTVQKINGVSYDLMEEAVSNGAIMTGNVTFKEKVHIGNLTVKHMNNINMKNLAASLLQRNQKQTIPGQYRFNVVKTPNLVAKQINDFNIETLVDVNKKEMQIMKGNFTIQSSTFLGPINGRLPCDLKEVVKTLESPPTRTWQSVLIYKNTTVLQEENILSRIIEATVRLDRNNTIATPVIFNSTTIANRVTTTKDINNINIKEIFDDALLNSEDHQLVTGFKTFTGLSAYSAMVDGDANIPMVNYVLVEDIDGSILRKDRVHNTTIKGQKLFYGGLQTKQLKTNSLSGLSPDHLVNLDNLTKIPNVFFDTLHVQENFNFNFINDMNFYEFMDSRLLRKSDIAQNVSGKVFFDSIHLLGPSKIPKINGIDLDNVVFDLGVQNVSSPKIFINNLVILGNVTIDTINGFNLTEKYGRSVLLDRSINIEDDMILEGLSSIDGNVTANKINGIPIERIKQLLNSEQPQEKTEEVDKIINQIRQILNENAFYLEDMPEEYMYLEKSKSLQVQIPNTISAQVVQTKDDIILHVTGEDTGDTCGLPNDCSCPVQFTLQITPEPQLFPGKESQRIFSYDTAAITVHLITNSMSTSSQCKRDNSSLGNEYVMLTWNWKVNNSSKTYTASNFTSGFISGVEFFTWDDDIYMIVCVFYDPHLDSHNSNCKVFKFGNDGTKINHVQTLPSKGAWSLHIFESPYQGLTLVIGNIYDSEKVISGTSTDIYNFKSKASQFVHIKKIVGPGALSVADAVIGGEVHIILAQKDTPLLIFNFDVMHRNYFLYQSIHFDAPVTSVSTFYIGSKNSPDVYLNIVTESGKFYVYSYKFIEGWKLESTATIEGLRSLIPFNFHRQTYLFAPSTDMSSLLTVKKHESN